MPLSIVVNNKARAIAPATLPTPPPKDAPPITAPAMASSSKNWPELGVAAPSLEVMRTAETP
jgi:hypothetical protein